MIQKKKEKERGRGKRKQKENRTLINLTFKGNKSKYIQIECMTDVIEQNIQDSYTLRIYIRHCKILDFDILNINKFNVGIIKIFYTSNCTHRCTGHHFTEELTTNDQINECLYQIN